MGRSLVRLCPDPGRLEQRLQQVEVVLHNQDNRELRLLIQTILPVSREG